MYIDIILILFDLFFWVYVSMNKTVGEVIKEMKNFKINNEYGKMVTMQVVLGLGVIYACLFHSGVDYSDNKYWLCLQMFIFCVDIYCLYIYEFI
jgi:uncharacterized membrane-anchored protein